ncbi:MAG: N-6 DNA methylase [Gammaproteobacteria bacterium]|nr:N-6 DNA methylase [Gammaproteobacteria bacterium]
MRPGQRRLDLAGRPTAGTILDRIRNESRDEAEKGRWFEQLFTRIALQEPEFEIEEIWRWPEWPQREELTGHDGRDIGIDLVARRTSGDWVAIQCKCYDERQTLTKGAIDSFLGASQHPLFRLRWVVATCRWGPNAERAIQGANPQVGQIDFRQHLDIQVEEEDARRPIQEPWPLQADAIEDSVEGLANHDRGRLIMACGTGKTFTALRIAEQVIEDGGRILFAAPTIALVSQARREWLRQTTRKLDCIVVCSDSTAGGRNETEDIRISELECPVTTDPIEIADSLTGEGNTRAVFCTYHSLGRVTDAQANHGVPAFDLAIADEAHRTTGAFLRESGASRTRKVDFQEFHDDNRLHAHKRLYMTATPRIYTERSKRKLRDRGVEVVDMGDQDTYGPQFHHLPFAKAVHADMLSDYRVIVLGVSQASVTPGLRRRLEDLDTAPTRKQAPNTNDMTRVLGVSLAVNGVTEGKAIEQPGKLPRTMAFANSIRRSKWYSQALMDREVLSATTRRLPGDRAMRVVSRHLDASASALQRNIELRALANADRDGECRIVSNVKLFTEGVDVPSLNAVAFLDPRDSQVDVVQAVGRVMRRAEGKRFGYIIIPVVVEPGKDVIEALERGTEGYSTVGRVLRALQAHDGRLAESPASFIKVYEQPTSRAPGSRSGEVRDAPGQIQREIELKEAEQGIFAHVAAASGLGKPGQLVADEITDTVRRASSVLQDEELEDPIAEALDLVPEDDGGAKGVCTVAALMLCNACLLQRRLRDEPEMKTIVRLDKVAGAAHPAEVLEAAWDAILEKDYEPVFRPALAVLRALPEAKPVHNAIRMLAECANRVADSLSELGYDHAGPLYHRILGSAKSDGAFYTNNLSAIMLARLAFPKGWIDWSDAEAVAKLRIIDPACGTGTLLMATLQTIKARVAESSESNDDPNALHKRLVEDVICGLDINQHGIQLAACNMTLGAPTVDYERMNLATMPHGPQAEGPPKAGSLEILTAPEEDRESLANLIAPRRSLNGLAAVQVNESARIDFRLRDVDAVIMNAPFTANENRNRKYGDDGRKAMQVHELGIQQHLERNDAATRGAVTANSIRTFFSPLGDMLLGNTQGTLAKVIPTTACTNASGKAERQFLAKRFHIETVVTSHDSRRPNFSENTAIHESLLICRRTRTANERHTQFVSIRHMPRDAKEAADVADAISAGKEGDWGQLSTWPAEDVALGDWSPAQWCNGSLAETVRQLEEHTGLAPAGTAVTFGATRRAAQDSWKRTSADDLWAIRVFDSVSAKIRRTMLDTPEQPVVPGGRRQHLHERVRQSAGHLMFPTRYDTFRGRVTALWSEVPTFGFGWMPARGQGRQHEQALCAWLNSTPGRLLLLNRRTKKLTYPMWSVDHLTSLPCPTPGSEGCSALADAWRNTCSTPLLPLGQGDECQARRAIDEAAALAIGATPDALATWRQRLAAEPTISNR